MRRTLNEVYRICQKACEGAGVPDGLDIEAARGTVWLTARGLPVLDTLLSDLIRSTDQTDPYSFDETRLAAGSLDATHKAGALIAPTLIGLLVAQAGDDGSKEPLRVSGVSAPLYLLPAAADHVPKGWHFRFSLKTADGGQFVLRAKPEGVDILGFSTTKLPALFDTASFDLNAVCAQADGEMPQGESQLDVLVASDTLSQREARALADGIDVSTDLWARLSALAVRVLVPATEASRQRGAGSGTKNSD